MKKTFAKILNLKGFTSSPYIPLRRNEVEVAAWVLPGQSPVPKLYLKIAP
jgi:hypothetical protein